MFIKHFSLTIYYACTSIQFTLPNESNVEIVYFTTHSTQPTFFDKAVEFLNRTSTYFCLD